MSLFIYLNLRNLLYLTLQDIKDYMDGLVEEGRLNEDYTLNMDYEESEEDFTPEKGEDVRARLKQP